MLRVFYKFAYFVKVNSPCCILQNIFIVTYVHYSTTANILWPEYFFYSFFRAMAENPPKTDSNEKSKYLLNSLKMNSNMKLNMKIQSTVEHEGLCTS